MIRDIAILLHRQWTEWFRPRSLGERGELAAMNFLQRLGYHIVSHSQKGRMGEIDLIAVDDRTVVFVEVKTRRSDQSGRPEEAVDDAKQTKLCRLAHTYLKRHDLLECRSRFDVIAIIWPDDHEPPEIKHVKNAFEYNGPGAMF